MEQRYIIPVCLKETLEGRRSIVTVQSPTRGECPTHCLVWVVDGKSSYWVVQSGGHLWTPVKLCDADHAFLVGLLRYFGLPPDAKYMCGLTTKSPAELELLSQMHNKDTFVAHYCSVSGMPARRVGDPDSPHMSSGNVVFLDVIRQNRERTKRAHR